MVSFSLFVLPLFLFLLVGGATAEEITVGILDGTTKLTAKVIKNGFNAGDKNFITPCGNFDSHGDNFALIVVMGNFSDYLIPKKGVTLCDLLTSSTSKRKYVYTPHDPRESSWDAFTASIAPSMYDEALGGSAEHYVGSGRTTLSFWGYDGEDNNADESEGGRVGGCCVLMPNQKPGWYRPYRLLLVPMPPAFYFSWGTVVEAAVTNGPVMFEVNVWNMRSELVDESITLDITTNGKKVTVTSPTGRYIHTADAPKAGTTTYDITVDLVSGPETANTKQLKAKVDVVGKLPWDVVPADGKNFRALVHFGGKGSAIGPLDESTGLDEDWFASTIVGGESQIRPIAGHFNTVEPPTLPASTQKWENVTTEDGVFQAEVPCKSVQYYAVAVYSAVSQRIVVKYEYDTAVVMYFAGLRFVPQESDGANKGSFAVVVTQGYHQVLVKLFSDNPTAGKENSQICTSTSKFSMSVIGTAVGYNHAVNADIPEGAYEMWNNDYMFYLLHYGADKEEYVYGGLDEDFINVRTATPELGDELDGKTWKPIVFYAGRIPVSAEKLPEGKEAAVSYVAIAIYNGYEMPVPVGWTFYSGGKTDFFIDGVSVYSRPSDGGVLSKNFTTPLSRGWHQLIVRIAATKGQSWSLTFFIHFDNYRLGGSHVSRSNLPLGIAPVRPNAPIVSLMELVDVELDLGAIPFDPSDQAVVNNEFTELPINANYMPSLLSTETIKVLGKERQYQWKGKMKADGIWGHRAFGGNFNSYWALVLYATEKMSVTLSGVAHGAYSIWLGGKVVGSAPLSWTKDILHSVTLNKGWNQLIIVLRANNSFHLIDAENGKMTWTMANAVCSETRNMEMCTLPAVCPLGVGRPGLIPVEAKDKVGYPSSSTSSVFLPVSTKRNEWVQVAANGGNNTALCQTWREAHGGDEPSWGETNDNMLLRRLVPCCGDNPPPSLWFSITPSSETMGEVGYTYDILVIVEPPVISVDNPAARTQTVTITCATPDATITYTTDDSDKVMTYTGPFKITKSSTIVAQAYAQNRESRNTRVFLKVPTELLADRVACLANEKCAVFLSGVDSGWHFSALTTSIYGREMKQYLDMSFALEQKSSDLFTGVVDIVDNHVILPPLPAGGFNAIVYNGAGVGKMMVNTLIFRETILTPSEVLGTHQTLFQIEGGVKGGDAVLLSVGPSGSPDPCDDAACSAAFKSNPERGAVLESTGDKSLYFSQDLYGYEGVLNCMCVCFSCYDKNTKTTTQETKLELPLVVSQTINVKVIKPPQQSESIVVSVQPSLVSNGDVLEMYGTFVTTSSSSYRVLFQPVNSNQDGKGVIPPQCEIQTVKATSLTCKMEVQAGVMGSWKVYLMEGEVQVPFGENAVDKLGVHAPNPVVESARGDCVAASVKCVTGAKMTFHGSNFNPVDPSYNDVVFGAARAANPVECKVTAVTKNDLSCDLGIPQDSRHGIYPISIRVRLSGTEWGEEQRAGYLVLGAGADAAGWVTSEPPPSVKPEEKKKVQPAIIVVIILSIILGLIIIGIITIHFCSKRANKAARELDDPEMRVLSSTDL